MVDKKASQPAQNTTKGDTESTMWDNWDDDEEEDEKKEAGKSAAIVVDKQTRQESRNASGSNIGQNDGGSSEGTKEIADWDDWDESSDEENDSSKPPAPTAPAADRLPIPSTTEGELHGDNLDLEESALSKLMRTSPQTSSCLLYTSPSPRD